MILITSFSRLVRTFQSIQNEIEQMKMINPNEYSFLTQEQNNSV